MSDLCSRCHRPVTLSTNMMRWISPPPAGGFTTHIVCPEEGETEAEAIARHKAHVDDISRAKVVRKQQDGSEVEKRSVRDPDGGPPEESNSQR